MLFHTYVIDKYVSLIVCIDNFKYVDYIVTCTLKRNWLTSVSALNFPNEAHYFRVYMGVWVCVYVCAFFLFTDEEHIVIIFHYIIFDE